MGANSNAYRDQGNNLNEQNGNDIRKTTKCVYRYKCNLIDLL